MKGTLNTAVNTMKGLQFNCYGEMFLDTTQHQELDIYFVTTENISYAFINNCKLRLNLGVDPDCIFAQCFQSMANHDGYPHTTHLKHFRYFILCTNYMSYI